MRPFTGRAWIPGPRPYGARAAEVRNALRERGALAVPMHLKNAVTKLMKSEGYGAGYVYAHDQPGKVAA